MDPIKRNLQKKQIQENIWLSLHGTGRVGTTVISEIYSYDAYVANTMFRKSQTCAVSYSAKFPFSTDETITWQMFIWAERESSSI